MAEPDEMASMQPICPQAHSGPFGSIGMWPISPATNVLPRRNRPCST